MFNIQPVLFHQCYLWFKKQSFTLVWKPNPPLLSRLCTFALVLMQWVSVGSTHEAWRWMCISSHDQWNLTPATMCRGSAAVRYMKHKLWSSRPCICTSATTFFFYLGKKVGGVVRLTAKPRYLLLLHRGEKKSNTVTALVHSKKWSLN